MLEQAGWVLAHAMMDRVGSSPQVSMQDSLPASLVVADQSYAQHAVAIYVLLHWLCSFFV